MISTQADWSHPVVVYGREGRTALALQLEPTEALVLLRRRLERQGYTLVEPVPADALSAWATDDTPGWILALARRVLLARDLPRTRNAGWQ